jgi:hypothetical protein
MNKRQLQQAVNAEMTAAANKVVLLKAQQLEIARQIEYWTRQEEAARVMSIRLDIEADQEAFNTPASGAAP